MAWPWIAGNRGGGAVSSQGFGNRGGGAVSSQGFGNRGGACSIENLDCGFAVQLVNVAAVVCPPRQKGLLKVGFVYGVFGDRCLSRIFGFFIWVNL